MSSVGNIVLDSSFFNRTDLSICPICSFRRNRLVDTPDIVLFLTTYLPSIAGYEHNEEKNCCLCRGLLQRRFIHEAVGNILLKFKSDSYDATSFNINISTPPVISFLDRCVGLSVDTYVVSVKEALRLLLTKLVTDDIGLSFVADSDFSILLSISGHQVDSLCARVLANLMSAGYMKKVKKKKIFRNSVVHRQLMDIILPNLSRQLRICPDLLRSLLLDPVDPCEFSVLFSRLPLYLGGRYLKFSRYLNQTPCDPQATERGESSVQDIVCNVLRFFFNFDDMKFIASGREDIDVRMLGNGRPFAFKIINARKWNFSPNDEKTIEKRINQSKDIGVRLFRKLSLKDISQLKQGEQAKQKEYIAVCWCPKPIAPSALKTLEELSPLEICQKTPIRVLHRRTLDVRRRSVNRIRCIPVDQHHFHLLLTTQAGTYVKEFVHGDFGRTRPSVSDIIGTSADILELDVTGIDFEWPSAVVSDEVVLK